MGTGELSEKPEEMLGRVKLEQRRGWASAKTKQNKTKQNKTKQLKTKKQPPPPPKKKTRKQSGGAVFFFAQTPAKEPGPWLQLTVSRKKEFFH